MPRRRGGRELLPPAVLANHPHRATVGTPAARAVRPLPRRLVESVSWDLKCVHDGRTISVGYRNRSRLGDGSRCLGVEVIASLASVNVSGGQGTWTQTSCMPYRRSAPQFAAK